MLTHLLYADDNILFCKENAKEAKCIKDCLGKYQQAYGQRINLDTCEMVFSPNTRRDYIQSFQHHPTIKISTSIHEYLGPLLNLTDPRDKTPASLWTEFGRKKLRGWKENYLSFEGKAMLIRVVAQVTPVYIMSCFLLPQGIYEQIE